MQQAQNKSEEKRFFAAYADAGEYNVFTDESNRLLVRQCLNLGRPVEGARMADLGCGSGVFTSVLRDLGYRAIGLDLSHSLTSFGKRTQPEIDFITGDIEGLPFADDSLDAILLSGVIHHFPEMRSCAREVFRVLRPGGVFMAFDPNRHNPFMWLYRDKASPLYSNKGVTANERPVVPGEVKKVFVEAGFRVEIDFLSGLSYRYIASAAMRRLLPVYNSLDSILFAWSRVKQFRSFVLTAGMKEFQHAAEGVTR
jgi:SAM-dependent methyltransferase